MCLDKCNEGRKRVVNKCSKIRECSAGAAKMQCMLVKEKNATEEWKYFYNQIEVFKHVRL